MSKIEMCPRGEMPGILCHSDEQFLFSELIGSKFLDEFIPLPDLDDVEQKNYIDSKVDHACGHEGTLSYWENQNGSHGWCCVACGKVHQWG